MVVPKAIPLHLFLPPKPESCLILRLIYDSGAKINLYNKFHEKKENREVA